ncbi:MAG: LptF/LptG family permease [Variibacter sp.]|nr:LptF/LptG family permease [Variibacter sp.]
MANAISHAAERASRWRRQGWFPWAGVPSLYAVRIVSNTAFQLTLIVLLIEAIFLAEKLNRVLSQAIKIGAPVTDAFKLLFFTGPEIFDLALPMALMVAVYRVALQCREDRELLVLSGMGLGAHHFVWMVMSLGVVAQLASVLVSGSIGPRSQYLERVVYFVAQYRALASGIVPGQFYTFGEHTVFAGRAEPGSLDRRLFIHKAGADTERVVVADRARLEGPDDMGRLRLHLDDVSAQDFRVHRTATRAAANPSPVNSLGTTEPCEVCETLINSDLLSTMRIGRFAQDIMLDDLVKLDPRGRTPAEWTTLELLNLAAQPGVRTAAHVKEAGRRLARALLCLLAPLIAGIALVFTTRITQAFMLPAACAALMCVDLVCSAVAEQLAPAGLAAVLFVTLALFAIFIAVLMRQTVVWQHAIVKPALARA